MPAAPRGPNRVPVELACRAGPRDLGTWPDSEQGGRGRDGGHRPAKGRQEAGRRQGQGLPGPPEGAGLRTLGARAAASGTTTRVCVQAATLAD